MSKEVDFMDYLRIIRRRGWLVAVVVVTACTLTGVYSLFVKEPVYAASTKIIVNQTPSASGANQLDLNQINTNIQLISTYKEIIKTPAILDEVIDQYPEFQLTSEQLVKKINVSSVNDTQVMTLVVTDTSYNKAAQMVNALSKVFKEEIPSLFNVENVSILNMAKPDSQVEPHKTEPNVALNLAIALVISLMGAVGLALLLEYMDDSIKTEKDVERYLGLPTLALITKVDSEEAKGKATRSKMSKVGELEHVELAK